MRHTRPDLIVPVRDRRQHRRIVTLRNIGYACLVLIALFAIVTVRSEMRHGPAEGDYGRLTRREIPPTPRTAPLEVVTEAAPVDDRTAADPLLVAPAVRSQRFLESGVATTMTPVVSSPEPSQVAFAPRANSHSRVAIVGGADGVATVGTAPQHVEKLRGGIFRND
jgi:hypothetical protein